MSHRGGRRRGGGGSGGGGGGRGGGGRGSGRRLDNGSNQGGRGGGFGRGSHLDRNSSFSSHASTGNHGRPYNRNNDHDQSNNRTSSSGSGRNTFIDKILAEGVRKLAKTADCRTFLQQLVIKPHTICLSKIYEIHSKHPDLIQHLLNLMDSTEDFNVVLQLMLHLGDDTLSEGSYREWRKTIFCALVLAGGFLNRVNGALRYNTLSEELMTALALLLLHSGHDEKVRTSEVAGEVAKKLIHSKVRGAADLALSFARVRSGELSAVDATNNTSAQSTQAAKAVMRPPGVRNHDNDHEDYRSIKIVPTVRELEDSEQPFLRSEELYIQRDHADEVDADQRPSISTLAEAEATHLDQVFRLTREDMLGPLREELREELREVREAPGKTRRLYCSPRLVSVEPKHGLELEISVPMPQNLAGRLRKMSHTERKAFMEDGPGRRVLAKDTLVVFLNANTTMSKNKNDNKDPKFSVVAIGVVMGRDAIFGKSNHTEQDNKSNDKGNQNANDKGKGKGKGKQQLYNPNDKTKSKGFRPALSSLHVNVELRSHNNGVPREFKDGVMKMGPHSKHGHQLCTYLFNASAGFFNYEPVLMSLQEMKTVPFANEIVHHSLYPTHTPMLAHMGMRYDQLSEPVRNAVASDPTQVQALKMMLDERVVLVQGPPGTGKTYIGVQMVKAIIAANPSVQILCLCYTNHALDSFLESLLDAGVDEDKFVRMGSTFKVSDRLKHRCLRELNADSTFNPNERRQYGVLKSLEEDTDNELKSAALDNLEWGKKPQWWSTVKDALSNLRPSMVEELTMPENTSGFDVVGKKGGKVHPGELWQKWCEGKQPGLLAPEKGKQHDSIWKLNSEQRHRLRDDMNREWADDKMDEYFALLQRKGTIKRDLQDLRSSSRSRVLSTATIIGCTTVSAAKQRNILAEISPDVVLVEEAGEIFESQVLCTLGRCKQLIMIGDHQQLRPKAEHFPLRVEAGRGFAYDRSLFERLVLERIQCTKQLATLTVQHRMRPEISEFPRCIMYPKLENAAGTLGRDNVIGVLKNVMFFNHPHKEESDEDSVALGSNSKINLFEVNMIIQIIQYLTKQIGMTADRICVVTPYLGQVSQIRTAMSKHQLSSEVNDLDHKDLVRFDLSQAATADATKSKVRVASIDNYQGEEADIILISMVRSNAAGDIGFMSSAERVNVLLSRARLGMFLVGNLNTFVNSKSSRGRKLWSKVKTVLVKQNAIFDSFPIVCPRHPGCQQDVTKPEDFETMSPDGGCHVRCGLILPCGHECPHHCHHHSEDNIRCGHFVDDVCPYDHRLKRKCSAQRPQCTKKVEWRCSRGHGLTVTCFKGRSLTCQRCNKEEAETKLHDKALAKAMEENNASKAKLEQTHQAVEEAAQLKRIKTDTYETEREIALARKANSRVPTTSQLPHAPVPAPRPQRPHPAPRQRNSAIPDLEETDHHAHLTSVNNDTTAPPQALPQAPAQPFPSARDIPSHVYTTTKNTKPKQKEKSSSLPSSSNGNNRVPPLPPLTQSEYTCVDDVVAIYNASGCSAAHDALEDRDVSDPAVAALLILLEEELTGHLPTPTCSLDVVGGMDASSTRALVCELASAIELDSRQRPFIAQDHALRYIKHASGKSLPQRWMQRAEALVKNPKVTKTSSTLPDMSTPTPSEAARSWQHILLTDKDTPSAMDDIMTMIGLEEVKTSLIEMYKRVKLDQERETSGPTSFNARFEGNPGTGKTTIARHYASFLTHLKVLPKTAKAIEITAANLKFGGIKVLKEKLEEIKKVDGGVMFVDEAYQLATDREGKQILDFILPLAEGLDTEYGKVVWIFAGYKDDMEKLFEHNAGLPSRFPKRFLFADYKDSELFRIFKSMLIQEPGKSKPKESVPKPSATTPNNTNALRNPYGGYGSYGGYGGYGAGPQVASGTTDESRDDRFGNTWTFAYSSQGVPEWRDTHGNLYSYALDDNIGKTTHPVVDRLTQQWTYNESSKKWSSTSGTSQQHYPGSPKPVASSMKQNLRKTPFTCNDKWARVSIRRLGRRRHVPGFGNARAVRVLFDRSLERQAARLTSAHSASTDKFALTREDLLGATVDATSLKTSTAWKELNEMVGLQPVKDQIEQLFKLVENNARREEEEKPLQQVVLNRLFLGNPGTGKTTAAKLYGKILAELGLLSKGEMIFKTASDFTGDVLGASETKTRDILKSAEGCVLVIDEAYSLCRGGSGGVATADPYGAAVIDTIVEQVQACPGDDRAVIMLGYHKEMENMLKAANPGLARRFQLENAFNFPDMSDDDLLKVITHKAKKEGLVLGLRTAKRAIRELAKARAKPNFGNAGAVDNLLSQAKQKLQMRSQSHGGTETLILADFGIERNGPDTTMISTLFTDLVGCEKIKTKMTHLLATVELARVTNRPLKDVVEYNWLFLGSPGTGKTTVARRMGQMFKALDLLPDDTVSEISASDLVSGYTGQAGKVTRDAFVKARGGVLFIDEAYQLDPSRGGPYMQEALDEIVKCLTHDDFVGQIVVILAGYTTEMEQMLAANSGLRSRFSSRLPFNDLKQEAVIQLLMTELKKQQVPLEETSTSLDELNTCASRLVQKNDFGNGRDVISWSKKTFAQVANRAARARDHRTTETGARNTSAKSSTMRDVQLALDEMLQHQSSIASSEVVAVRPSQSRSTQQSASQNHVAPRVAIRQAVVAKEKEITEPEEDEEEELADASNDENLFGGMNTLITSLQTVLDKEGLNSKQGVQHLASLTVGSAEFERLVDMLVATGMDADTAREQLIKWQRAQDNLTEQVQQAQMRAKTRRQQAIWRCGVCGRADKPYIACYVAPYIVRYQAVPDE